MLGLFAFVSPWLLLGLAALPALWFLIRVTPPSPRRVAFPPLRLLLGLNPRDETPARTPLWLLLMRMVLMALIVLALAHPLLNPSSGFNRSGPLVIAVDDGWSAARHWSERRGMLDRLLDDAERDGRQVVLFGTAPPPGLNAAPALSIQRATDARASAAKLAPMPWPADRTAALARLDRLGLKSAAAAIWLSDGIDDGTARDFARGLERLGPLRVMADGAIERAHLLERGAGSGQGPRGRGTARRVDRPRPRHGPRGWRGRATAGARDRQFQGWTRPGHGRLREPADRAAQPRGQRRDRGRAIGGRDAAPRRALAPPAGRHRRERGGCRRAAAAERRLLPAASAVAVRRGPERQRRGAREKRHRGVGAARQCRARPGADTRPQSLDE